MTQEHPVTPPPELVKQWREAPEFSALSPCVMVTVTTTKLQDIATQAARWGADAELDACCEWIPKWTPWDADQLRADRRPKPPSLKEQALEQLDGIAAVFQMSHGGNLVCDTIRRALEALPDSIVVFPSQC
jgi:hypothetical protein